MDTQAFAIIATGVVLFALAPRRLGDSPLTGPIVLLSAVLSLTAVRMIPIAFSLLGAGLRAPTVGFLAWFGPGGLASILFALFIVEKADTPGAQTILATVVVTVALSILAQGLTAAPAAIWYGKAIRRERECVEAKAVNEMPTRVGTLSRAAGG